MNNMDIEVPPSESILVQLPYDKEIFLCPKTLTRWRKAKTDYIRDLSGEEEWDQMGSYIGKSYEQVFRDSLAYAKQGR